MIRICSMILFITVLSLFGCSENNHLLFTKVSPDESGILFKNSLEENEDANVLKYSYFYNGGGVAIGDINNDGLQDILFTGNMVPTRLYLNKDNFEFEDITKSSGIASAQGWCTGATIVDINGDGNADIYICRSADRISFRRKNLLYINNGKGQFSEQADKYGLADQGYSSQAAFFDYDKDGDLDMFLINHSLQQYANEGLENPALRKNQQPMFANKLYRNDKGHYSNVSQQAGITSNVLTFGLGLAISDLNNDGWPDVYVSNDFNEPDYLFINNKNGSFTEQLSECMDEVSLFSMGSDAADFNNDGLTDLLTLDMLQDDNRGQKMHNGAENFDKFQMLYKNGFYYQSSRNMLHINNGDGTFSETGQMSGIAATDWSWSALFCDYDNDGFKDLFVSNGYVKDYTNMDFIKYSIDRTVRERKGGKNESLLEYISKMPAIVKQNYLFKNNGNTSFTRNNREWGLQEENVSSGAAYADLDNDGDMDLVISNINEEAGIYRNNNSAGHYLKIKLKGNADNSYGIGAKIKLYCGKDVFYQEQSPVRGFQSSVDPVINFGLGGYEQVDSIVIIWPDDQMQIEKNIKTNQTIIADHGNADKLYRYGALPGVNTLFKEDSLIRFTHVENDFNDFTLQSLMPGYLSRSGPCLAKADINNDGLEDLFIGAAKDHEPALFIQMKDGSFVNTRSSALKMDSTSEDTDAVFFDADGDGDQDLYVVSGGYEFNEGDSALRDRLYMNDGKGNFKQAFNALPGIFTSKSCVKPCDIDNDGDIDLFIGGRVIPGRYPLPAQSYVLLNDGKGVFTDATASVAPMLKNIGLVTDAVWIDVTEDKIKDLVIVGEWMPVIVLKNDNGRLKDISAEMIRFNSSGWWNRILSADMDDDGDEDLIIGNTGLNTIFSVNEKEPLGIYYKDFDQNGSIDPILCYFINGISYPIASRDDLTDQLPFLRKKFLEYNSYADATINDIFTPEQLKDADKLNASLLTTVYLENNGNKGFKMHQLPREAQFSPVFAISALDANKDGKKDILLAGNNSWVRVKFGRYRANHGLLFTGDGKGSFKYVPQYESGLNIRNNTRSMLNIKSGTRTHLVIGVNDGAVRTYRLN